MTYFNRTGYVSIEGNDGRWYNFGGDDDALDFKFKGEKYGSIYTWFDVSILGLSSDTINELTVWNPADSIKKKRHIKVYAGYKEGGINEPLFEGIVFEAMPTNPPEMWMNFRCLKMDYSNESTIIEFKNKTLMDILYGLAVKAGMTSTRWKSEVNPNKIAKHFKSVGSIRSAIDSFASTFGVKVYEDEGVLIACDKREWLKQPQNVQDISTETGMLALGNITIAGAKIKRRLNDSVPLMGWIRLKSTIVPKANGLYCVIKKSHQGHFRGNEWFTELECIRQGADV